MWLICCNVCRQCLCHVTDLWCLHTLNVPCDWSVVATFTKAVCHLSEYLLWCVHCADTVYASDQFVETFTDTLCHLTDLLLCLQALHSVAQEGLFYTIPEAEVKQLFQKGLSVQFARQVSVVLNLRTNHSAFFLLLASAPRIANLAALNKSSNTFQSLVSAYSIVFTFLPQRSTLKHSHTHVLLVFGIFASCHLHRSPQNESHIQNSISLISYTRCHAAQFNITGWV